MNPHFQQAKADPTIKTVSVAFGPLESSPSRYTYKTRLNLKRGDTAIVKTERGFSLVTVDVVHKTPKIDPDSKIEYKWIAQKVCKKAFLSLEQEDENFSSENHLLGDLM